MIETIAKQLRLWIEQRYGAADAELAFGGYGAGDLYYGNVTVDSLHYQRGDLVIKLEMSVHQDSGQIDQWDVEIAGADEGDRDALVDVFHPRVRSQHYLHLNNHLQPTLRFNGVELRFPEPL